MKIIAKRIREARKSIGMSQEGLAQLTGLHPTAIGHLEAGSRIPSTKALVELAKALRTSTDFLLGLEHEKEQLKQTVLRKLSYVLEDVQARKKAGAGRASTAKKTTSTGKRNRSTRVS